MSEIDLSMQHALGSCSIKDSKTDVKRNDVIIRTDPVEGFCVGHCKNIEIRYTRYQIIHILELTMRTNWRRRWSGET